MNKLVKVFILGFIFSLIVCLTVQAGTTKKKSVEDYTENQKKILETAYKMNNTMINMNKKHPGLWRYGNNKVAKSWQSALSTKKYRTDCVRGAIWLTKEAGLSYKKYYKIINLNGSKTVKQLLSKGQLQCGDRIDYYNFQHSNVYLGNNLWFDTGRAYCHSYGPNAPFVRWIGQTKTLNRKIRCIFRLKK